MALYYDVWQPKAHQAVVRCGPTQLRSPVSYRRPSDGRWESAFVRLDAPHAALYGYESHESRKLLFWIPLWDVKTETLTDGRKYDTPVNCTCVLVKQAMTNSGDVLAFASLVLASKWAAAMEHACVIHSRARKQQSSLLWNQCFGVKVNKVTWKEFTSAFNSHWLAGEHVQAEDEVHFLLSSVSPPHQSTNTVYKQQLIFFESVLGPLQAYWCGPPSCACAPMFQGMMPSAEARALLKGGATGSFLLRLRRFDAMHGVVALSEVAPVGKGVQHTDIRWDPIHGVFFTQLQAPYFGSVAKLVHQREPPITPCSDASDIFQSYVSLFLANGGPAAAASDHKKKQKKRFGASKAQMSPSMGVVASPTLAPVESQARNVRAPDHGDDEDHEDEGDEDDTSTTTTATEREESIGDEDAEESIEPGGAASASRHRRPPPVKSGPSPSPSRGVGGGAPTRGLAPAGSGFWSRRQQRPGSKVRKVLKLSTGRTLASSRHFPAPSGAMKWPKRPPSPPISTEGDTIVLFDMPTGEPKDFALIVTALQTLRRNGQIDDRRTPDEAMSLRSNRSFDSSGGSKEWESTPPPLVERGGQRSDGHVADGLRPHYGAASPVSTSSGGGSGGGGSVATSGNASERHRNASCPDIASVMGVKRSGSRKRSTPPQQQRSASNTPPPPAAASRNGPPEAQDDDSTTLSSLTSTTEYDEESGVVTVAARKSRPKARKKGRDDDAGDDDDGSDEELDGLRARQLLRQKLAQKKA